ncbi:MgtC/SapB family protein [Candidatus Peregrinibacteria bacterium]|nr:MgtC/SapB family protein [Candidatus Peregrinibacteria bacterium]
MMDFLILQKFLVAVALGALIGLEREQKSQQFEYQQFGGIRTFALVGLLGALSYFLSTFSIAYFVVISVGFFALLTASYILTSHKYGDVGATSEIASILVYLIGVLSFMGNFLLAIFFALLVLTILHFKSTLHKWAKHLKNEDLISAIKFIAVTFVVLPILPNENFGPYGFFNPYVIWLMVVLVSGLSYLSYIAIKIFGSKKGIELTGFLAGFVSSTALAVTFSHASRKNKFIVNPYVLATIIASTALFFRVLLEVFAVSREFLEVLYVPMLTMGFTGGLICLFFWLRREKNVPKIQEKAVKNPFSLGPALKFGLFFTFILFFTNFANETFGQDGVYVSSFISGFFDVDAITLYMANAVNDGFDKNVAVMAVAIAAMANTMTKALIFFFIGNRKIAIKLLLSFSVIVASGIISTLFL